MDEDTAALVAMLRTTRRAPMRLDLARRLAEKRDPELAPVLLELLDSANDARVVPVVTVAISGLQALGAVVAPYAQTILEDRGDPRRAFMPLLIASALGESAASILMAALYDEEIEVAINAATQLGQIRSEQAFEPLRYVLADEEAPAQLRGVAAAALGASRDPRALPILAELSATDDPDLLAGAIDGLADLRDPAGAVYLERILARPNLDETTNRAVRLGLLAMERYRSR
jgi:HEAT repeat protein